jgi:exopolyphosphatase/guanosine-5'-triphosphate,3'-diphosphate pyrophosphatase
MATADGGSRHAESAPPTRESSPPLFAALDLGTNNCRLLVAAPEGSYFRVIDAFSRNVRLGEGVERTGALSSAAMGRTIDALRICAGKIRKHRVRDVRIIATEACRRASNGAEFLERVRRETGLRMELITPHEEARFAIAGCAPLLDPAAEHLMVFDIGGGSTELIWVDLSGAPRERREELVMSLAPRDGGVRDQVAEVQASGARIVDWVSAPVGVATLHDKFNDVPDDRKRYALMSWFFEEKLEQFGPYEESASKDLLPMLQIIGASGTVTTLGSLHLGLRKYDRSRVDGLWLDAADIGRHVHDLIDMGPMGRVGHPSIGSDRAQLVIAGGAILQTILRIWPVQRIRVADRGLREGMLYSMMQPMARRGGAAAKKEAE